MTINKRKKHSRARGLRWHGYGRGAAHHKGAGNRGGRGRAGSGKRADQKKPSYQKVGKHYLGSVGFTSKSMVKITPINIKDIQQQMDAFVAQGFAEKKGESYSLNLENLGYNKLLGTGVVKLKMNITTEFASAGAVEKIEEAGGKVTVLNAPSEEKSDDKAEANADEE
jgi:large subunit ribosomal protein L15